jgi:hypothetical protein
MNSKRSIGAANQPESTSATESISRAMMILLVQLLLAERFDGSCPYRRIPRDE